MDRGSSLPWGHTGTIPAWLVTSQTARNFLRPLSRRRPRARPSSPSTARPATPPPPSALSAPPPAKGGEIEARTGLNPRQEGLDSLPTRQRCQPITIRLPPPPPEVNWREGFHSRPRRQLSPQELTRPLWPRPPPHRSSTPGPTSPTRQEDLLLATLVIVTAQVVLFPLVILTPLFL